MSWKEIRNTGGSNFSPNEMKWHGLRIFKVPQNTKETFKLMMDVEKKNDFKNVTGWSKLQQIYRHGLKGAQNNYAQQHTCTRYKYFCPYCYINLKSESKDTKPFPLTSRIIAPVVRESDRACGYLLFTQKMQESMELIEGSAYTGHIVVQSSKTTGWVNYIVILAKEFEAKPNKADFEMWAFANYESAWKKSAIVSQKFFGEKINGMTVEEWMDDTNNSDIDVGSWGGLLDGVEAPKVNTVKKQQPIESKDATEWGNNE